MVNDPEIGGWKVYDGDGLAGGCGDFIILAQKVDGVVVIDPALCTQSEV